MEHKDVIVVMANDLYTTKEELDYAHRTKDQYFRWYEEQKRLLKSATVECEALEKERDEYKCKLNEVLAEIEDMKEKQKMIN